MMIKVVYPKGHDVSFVECQAEVLERDDLIRFDGEVYRFHAGVGYNSASDYLKDESVAVHCPRCAWRHRL